MSRSQIGRERYSLQTRGRELQVTDLAGGAQSPTNGGTAPVPS
jgi:hypothetical protein